jgi:protein-S-isoprenylcysteine O-methyltransferase Ste14
MHFWFFICILGAIAVLPIHFLSVEHIKLQHRYGRNKGKKIGEIFGLISGWGFFLFWVGIWISPQPRFSVPFFQDLTLLIPFVGFSISLLNLLIFLPFITMGAYLGIFGVKQTTIKVAEIHRTEKIVTTGVYSKIRHPQYLGGLLAHLGISLLLSSLFSLYVTPVMVSLIYLVSKKEEEELIREFGEVYKDYIKNVPMFIPKV